MEILDLNAFCLYKNREVGIAYGCFAGDKFANTSGDEYISEVSGEKFAWLDKFGDHYTDSKYHMTRPTKEQVINALKNNYFAVIAYECGLIKF